jgi:hypothetical protein
MTQKTEKLLEIADLRGINKKDHYNDNGKLNRKSLCDALRALDIKEKKPIDQVVVEDEKSGEITTPEVIKKKAIQIIFYSMEENDLPYVQLGLNGRAYYIPKEKEVWVPHELVEGCLKNSVMTKMVMDIDHKGNIRYIKKQVPRFNYNILDIRDIEPEGE